MCSGVFQIGKYEQNKIDWDENSNKIYNCWKYTPALITTVEAIKKNHRNILSLILSVNLTPTFSSNGAAGQWPDTHNASHKAY